MTLFVFLDLFQVLFIKMFTIQTGHQRPAVKWYVDIYVMIKVLHIGYMYSSTFAPTPQMTSIKVSSCTKFQYKLEKNINGKWYCSSKRRHLLKGTWYSCIVKYICLDIQIYVTYCAPRVIGTHVYGNERDVLNHLWKTKYNVQNKLYQKKMPKILKKTLLKKYLLH